MATTSEPRSALDKRSKQTAVANSTFGWWPMIAFILCALGLDLVSIWIIDIWMMRRPTPFPAIYVLFGVLLGQACFAILIAGLWARQWLIGYVFSCLIASAGVTLLVLSANTRHYQFAPQPELFWIVCATPLILLVAPMPLFLLRSSRGWCLERGAGERRRVAGRIEDLFIVSAVVATSLFLARIPPTIWTTPPGLYWPVLGFSAVSLMCISILMLLPVIWTSFRIASTRKRLLAHGLVALAITLLAPSLTLLLGQLVEPAVLVRDAVVMGVTVASVAVVTLLFGIWSILLCRVELSYFSRGASAVASRVPDFRFGGREATGTSWAKGYAS